MSASSPFVPVRVRCPFCGVESVQRYIKSRMYTEDVVEEDSHVAEYGWENADYAAVRPNLYHIWHCPACHFCEEKEVFRGEDSSRGKLELIREKLLVHSRMPGSFIGVLGPQIDFSRDVYHVDSAILAHLLAIYEQELLSTNMRQYAKLARFYLRLAWLYREKTALGIGDEHAYPDAPAFGDYLLTFRDQWPGLPADEDSAMETALERYRDILKFTQNTDVKYEIKIMNLIVAMLRRLERYPEALQMVKGVFAAAMKARRTARAALDKNINPAANQILCTFLSGVIEKAKDTAEELQNKIFARELPAAREAVLKMGPVDAVSVVEKLRVLQFSDVTCRRVGKLFEKQAEKNR